MIVVLVDGLVGTAFATGPRARLVSFAEAGPLVGPQLLGRPQALGVLASPE